MRIARQGARWRGSAEIAGLEAREVSGESCESVAKALALIISVALDPVLSAEAPPGPAPEPVNAPAERRDIPPFLPDPPPDPRARPVWGVGVSPFVASGAAPAALFGVGGFGHLSLRGSSGPAVRLTLSRASTGIVTVGGGAARFVLSTARVEACPGTAAIGDGTLTGCLSTEGGSVRAEGVARGQIDAPGKAARFWLDAGLSTRFSWSVLPGLRVELWGGVSAPVTRRRYVFEGPREVIHEPAPLVGRMGLGLASELP